MKSGLKTALCLLLTLIAFVGVTIASSLGLFSSIERRFYEPAQIKLLHSKLDEVTDVGNDYFSSLLKTFGSEKEGFLNGDDVFSFLESSPSDGVLKSLGLLVEKNKGLEGIRIVDGVGRRVHFSSYRTDYRIDSNRRIYSNYSEIRTPLGNPELPFEQLNCFSKDKEKNYGICFDSSNQRIIYSFPLIYKENNFCVFFYVNTRDFINSLIEKKVLSVNENLLLLSSEDNSIGGFVLGLQNSSKKVLGNEIVNKWKAFSSESDEIIQVSNDNAETLYTLFTNKSDFGLMFSTIFDDSLITLPKYVRILLLVCSFITVCLFILILFNLKKDDDVIIKDRIKRVQFELISEYFEKNIEKAQIAGIVQAEKNDISEKIKKSLGRRGKKHSVEIDAILEKSWSEIIGMLSLQSEKSSSVSPINMDEIKQMFEQLLASGKFATAIPINTKESVQVAVPKKSIESEEKTTNEDDLENVESLDEIEDAESAEEVDGIEDAENAEEADGIEDVESAEEVETIDDVENAEEVEAVDDAENAEEVEVVDDVDAAEDVEAVDDVETAEEVETIDDAESAEEVDGIEDAESAEEVEAVDDAESAEEVDAVDDAETAEEVDAVDDAESAEEVETIEDAETAEEVDAVDDAEVAEEVEAVGDAESAEEVETVDDAESAEEVDDIEDAESAEEVESVDDAEVAEEVEAVDDAETAEEVDGIDDAESAEEVEAVDDDLYKFASSPVCDNVEKINLIKNALLNNNPEEESKTMEGVNNSNAESKSGIIIQEPLIFSDPTVEQDENPDMKFANEFYTKDPKEELISAKIFQNKEEYILPEENNNLDEIEEIDEVEPISENERMTFSMTKFGANNNHVTDLSGEAIVEDTDGVYRIPEDFVPVDCSIDKDFKNLVDSVLK